MNRSTLAPAVPVSPTPRLAYVNEQPGLPVSFEAKRGCDQIRARIYHDPRLTSQEAIVALALSEFVNTTTYTAHPKQARLAGMVKTNPSQVSRLLHRLEEKAVIEIDRCRTYCRYVFQAAWRGSFQPLPGRSRFASHANQDLRLTQITGEPGTENQEISDPIAAAGTPPAREAARRQQQQRQHDRIDGLIAAIAARSRELDMDYDERDERRRLEEGEIDVDALQQLANELRDKTRTRRIRRAHGPYGPVS